MAQPPGPTSLNSLGTGHLSQGSAIYTPRSYALPGGDSPQGRAAARNLGAAQRAANRASRTVLESPSGPVQDRGTAGQLAATHRPASARRREDDQLTRESKLDRLNAESLVMVEVELTTVVEVVLEDFVLLMALHLEVEVLQNLL